MAGDSVDILSIHPAQDLTVGQCRDLGAHFYDRYAWDTNNQEDLWRAAMALYLVRIAKLRKMDSNNRTINEVSHGFGATAINPDAVIYRKLSYIEYTIPKMVRCYLKTAQGQRALNTMVEVTGLSK